jgi:hypothetical protein
MKSRSKPKRGALGTSCIIVISIDQWVDNEEWGSHIYANCNAVAIHDRLNMWLSQNCDGRNDQFTLDYGYLLLVHHDVKAIHHQKQDPTKVQENVLLLCSLDRAASANYS